MYLASNLSVSLNLLFYLLRYRYVSVQLLEDEPFEAFRPTVEKLIKDKDQNKQRAAAELLAGILGGTNNLLRFYEFT
jgi:hypothetical protein